MNLKKMFFLALFAILSVTVANSEINSEIISKEHLQNLIFKIINEPKPNFEPCTENLIKKALFGDLIEIKRKGYFHWCVFVSEAAVIQLNNPEFEKLNPENAFENFTGNVEFRNLFELAGSDLCRINNKKNESVRKGLHTRNDSEIAQKMIEELKNNVTSYNVFSKNCEHFATNLRFGVSFSSQVRWIFFLL